MRGRIPSREILEKHAQKIKEISPSEVIAMLQVLQASETIQRQILDVLEREYQLSEGKLQVMIHLHQNESGLFPSELAELAGVSRATISVMLRRMKRDALIYDVPDESDGRAKRISLTEEGRKFMDDILPEHYLRITKLMGKLSKTEQETLITLLHKIVSSQ